MSPWVLRICLDSKSVNVKKLKMLEIASKITDFFGNGVHVIYTDDNSQTGLVLRVRILVQDEDRLGETEETISGSEDHELLRRMQKQLLENLHLRGVAGIRKVRSLFSLPILHVFIFKLIAHHLNFSSLSLSVHFFFYSLFYLSSFSTSHKNTFPLTQQYTIH